MALMIAIGSLQRVRAALNQHIWKDERHHLGNGHTNNIAMESIKSGNADHVREKESSEKRANPDVAVAFEKVTTKWREESDVIAKEISFNIPRNGLTVLYGPTGSGKSTLLRLMIGDNVPLSGTVSTMDQLVGFCAQPPWIANLSIRDNIVGAFAFDEKRYQMVLHTCALDHDIEELGDGDQHICGLNGQSVSGGQKARIVCNRFSSK